METNKVSIEESGLTFEFNEGTLAVKFDDGAFYRSEFNKSPESKGVDILADDKKLIQLIEIKNCIGHERENMWRTSINNSKVESAPHDLDVRGRESLDIEIAKKKWCRHWFVCMVHGVNPKAQKKQGNWKRIGRGFSILIYQKIRRKYW